MDINDFIEHVQIMRVTDNDIVLILVPDSTPVDDMHEIREGFNQVIRDCGIDCGTIVIPNSMQVKLIRKEDIHDGIREPNTRVSTKS